ncbi:ABC transporter substrate-binding protein [Kingella denitrificans]
MPSFKLPRRRFAALLLTLPLLGTALPTFAAPATRNVTDIKGRQVSLPAQVNRVANLWHANNQIVLLLGGADKLVATTSNIRQSPWFAAVYPRIRSVTAVTDGQNLQLEELAAARPEAVLTSSANLQQQSERAGLKTVLVGFQDFAGLRQTVRITAQVLGGNAPSIAENYIRELDGNINLVSSRVRQIPTERRPSVLHITGGSNLTEIDGGKSMIGEWVRYAGGRNALPNHGNKAVVNLEEIIAAKPDIIIVGSGTNGSGQQAVAAIRRNPAWQTIPAVKNGRVYANPAGTFPWDRYSAEAALQILWAAKLFHPQQFADIDMNARTRAFYRKYYGYNLSQPAAARILAGQPPQ